VTQQGGLESLGMTPDEINNSYLSMDERLAIQGDTNNRSKYFNPNYEGQLYDSGAAKERGAVDDYGTALKGAYDPTSLRPGAGYQQSLNNGVGEFSNSIDQALDPNKLNVSDEFLKNYQLTPQQQHDIEQNAANVVGTRDKAAIGELERRSRAAGTNPLGVAALRNRMERDSSANAADAATSARVAAGAEAAKRMQVGESMRLGAAGDYAGLKTNAAGRVLDAGYRAATTGEQARVAGERDIADRNTYAAQQGGQARMGSESDLAKRQLALQQNITQVGNEAERDKETANQARSASLATNRLANDQYVQGSGTRGDGDEQRTCRSLPVRDRCEPRRCGEARGYYNAQGNQANANYNQAGAQRTSLYGTQAGAGQSATNTQAKIEDAAASRPKWYDKLIGAAVGGAGALSSLGYKPFAQGGLVTEPTMALLGENGPEMVVPFSGQNAQLPPSAAMVQPGQPAPFATAPPPPRGRAPYSQQYRYAS
jgi:hypothetical protein